MMMIATWKIFLPADKTTDVHMVFWKNYSISKITSF